MPKYLRWLDRRHDVAVALQHTTTPDLAEARPSQRESLVQPPVKYATSFTWLRKRTRHTFLHRRREQLQVYYLRSNCDNFGTIFLRAQFLLII